jgi:hypothetical protein
MTNIDYERLELIVTGDIHEAHRGEFDIPAITRKATIDTDGEYKGCIRVKSGKFIIWYDANTYIQVNGIGDDGSG